MIIDYSDTKVSEDKCLLNRLAHNESGAFAVIFALILPVFLGCMALSIDMGYMYWVRTQLQHTASASALASVAVLIDGDNDGEPDGDDFRDMALRYAEKNMTQARHGYVLNNNCGIYSAENDSVTGSTDCAQIFEGDWNAVTRIFTPRLLANGTENAAFDSATMDLDAVQVITLRTASNGNGMYLSFAAIIGLSISDTSATAVAWNNGGSAPPPNCYQSGMIAGDWYLMQSDNSYEDDFCIYGDLGVQVQSGNEFEDGVSVGLGPTGEIDEQGDDNDGLDDAIQTGEFVAPLLALQVDNLIADLEAGNYPSFVDFNGSGGVVNVSSLPSNPVPNTTYIVNGTASISSDVSNIVVRAEKIDIGSDVEIRDSVLMALDSDISNANISIGSDFELDNVVLAAYKRIDFGSHGEVGEDECEDGVTMQIFAGEDVIFQSDSEIGNSQVAAGRNVEFGSDNEIQTGNGATIQAINDISVQSEGEFESCSDDDDSDHHPGPAQGGVSIRIVD